MTPETPRDPYAAQQAAKGGPLVRQGGGDAVSRPSFEHLTGEIIWRTYPSHLWLSVEQAEDVAALVRDEIIRTAMRGAGPCGAVGMAVELQTAINAARRWRQAGGAA
jgi:hypothetical protein